MRLDLFLYKRGDFGSRHHSQIAIKDGSVSINGKIVKKPAYQVDPSDVIKYVKPPNPYVSQGGLKLDTALERFDIDLEDTVVLDVGASTGGFTHCALSHGAKQVYAVDVGRNQLHESLKNDARVISRENTNFLDTSASDYDPVDLVVCDVSFVSSLKILSHVLHLFGRVPVIMLVKPQFETRQTPKSGVIRDAKLHESVLLDYLEDVTSIGFTTSGLLPSPIKGQSGNIEFLLYLGDAPKEINVRRTVKEAHAVR